MTLEVSSRPSGKSARLENLAYEKGWQILHVSLNGSSETTELEFSLVSRPGMIEIRQMKFRSAAVAGPEVVLDAEQIKSRLRVSSGGLLIWSYPGTVCRLLVSRYALIFTMGGWDFRQLPPPVELVIELLHDERPLLPLILAPEVLNTINFERNTLTSQSEERRQQAERATRELADLRAQASYQPGTVIDFTDKGNALVYQRSGWSSPEDWGTWTDGGRAVLNIRFCQTPKAPIRLHFVARAFVHSSHPETRVDVSVNGLHQESWVLTSGDLVERSMEISAETIGRETCEIIFDIPSPVSPAQLGHSSDERHLGLGLARMSLSVARSRWRLGRNWLGIDHAK
jgi:hypothetical protein